MKSMNITIQHIQPHFLPGNPHEIAMTSIYFGCRCLSYLYLSELGRPSAVQKLLGDLEDARSLKVGAA
jgi:hypothetical protein